jgi:hypothetical protein
LEGSYGTNRRMEKPGQCGAKVCTDARLFRPNHQR